MIKSIVLALCLLAIACRGTAPGKAVYPGKIWETKTPAEVGLDAAKLDAFRDFLGGRGCIVRHGYMVYTWGDYTTPGDVASACKPVIAHFLFKAVEDGRIKSLDQKVSDFEPRLKDTNKDLGYKDRNITFRHMANQTSCYGVKEAPGTAFDYNDWQMALLWDTLYLKIYGATYANIDATVLHPMLADPLQCEDNPTWLFFTDKTRGRLGISPRDFARFGLLYLHQGNWKGKQLISKEHAVMAVTSPLPVSIPRTKAEEAEMIPGQRSGGSQVIPDNQCDHNGSYSWLWWTNGIGRDGKRNWPDAPVDTYGAFGHNGMRAVVVIPSLDMVVSWNETKIEYTESNPRNEAFKLLLAAVLDKPGVGK